MTGLLKKTITYATFDGNEITEDFFFHLTTPEVAKMQVRYGGDLGEYATNLVQSNNSLDMLNFVEDLVLSAYGIKSTDGRKFTKTASVREDFEYSAAYAELFEELLTDQTKAQAFGQGLIEGAKAPNTETARIIAEHRAKKLAATQSTTE